MKFSFYDTFELKELTTNSNVSTVEIMKVGKYFDDRYGKFEITEKMLDEIIKNYNKLNDKELMVDYNHLSANTDDPEQAKAAGWIKKIIKKGNDKLEAIVEWTEQAADYIRKKEYRFISPEWIENTKDNISGALQGATLFAIGLVNRPFLDMSPVELRLLKQESKTMEVKKMKELLIKKLSLSDVENISDEDIEKKLDESLEELKTLKASSEEQTKELSEYKDNIKSLSEELKIKNEEIEGFKTLITKREEEQKEKLLASKIDEGVKAGKIQEALKETYMSIGRKDPESLDKILSTKESVLDRKSLKADEDNQIKLTDQERKVAESLKLSAEEFKKFEKEENYAKRLDILNSKKQ